MSVRKGELKKTNIIENIKKYKSNSHITLYSKINSKWIKLFNNKKKP